MMAGDGGCGCVRWCREAVAAGGGDRAGGEGAGVRAAGGLRRRAVRARGLRRGALARPRRGARLQRLRATRRRRRRRLPAPDSLPRHLPRRLPPRPRRLRRRRLLLRPPSYTGDGRAGQGHRHLHRLVGVGHRLRRLLRSKLRQVRAERAVPVAGQGVPAGRRPHCSHDHRRRHRRTQVREGEVRRRDGVVGGGGPGRGGAELLARPRAGQERVDAGDGHPVAVAHVVGRPIGEVERHAL
uniref:Uncharacterized protein n=1 Tax=Oryza rufipogon TaxID=4529 RepID=A0A0E0QK94_ORYRU